jgi:hypothetical protein
MVASTLPTWYQVRPSKLVFGVNKTPTLIQHRLKKGHCFAEFSLSVAASVGNEETI